MTERTFRPTRGKSISLAVGFFLLLAIGFSLAVLLNLWTASKKEFGNQSYEELLASIPNPIRTDSTASAIETLRNHRDELFPRLQRTLIGPPPLRYRVTKNIPRAIRETLSTWLPRSSSRKLFLSANDILQSREQALRALTVFPPEDSRAIIQTLRTALHRPEITIQQQGIEELGRFGTQAGAAVNELLPFLSSYDQKLRYQAVKTLGSIGEQSSPAIGSIQNLMGDSSEMVRAAAIVAFGRVVTDKQNLSPSLKTALSDSSSLVRYAAAQAIGRTACNDPASVTPLIQALQDPEFQVRRNAAIALGRMGPLAATAVAPLTKALWDDRMEVRISSAEALGNIGRLAKSAIPHLIDALNNDFAGMGIPAHEAIKKIDPASDIGIAPR